MELQDYLEVETPAATGAGIPQPARTVIGYPCLEVLDREGRQMMVAIV